MGVNNTTVLFRHVSVLQANQTENTDGPEILTKCSIVYHSFKKLNLHKCKFPDNDPAGPQNVGIKYGCHLHSLRCDCMVFVL